MRENDRKRDGEKIRKREREKSESEKDKRERLKKRETGGKDQPSHFISIVDVRHSASSLDHLSILVSPLVVGSSRTITARSRRCRGDTAFHLLAAQQQAEIE